MHIVSEAEILLRFDGIKVVRARELERNGAVKEASVEADGWVRGHVIAEGNASFHPVVRVRLGERGVEVRAECTCQDRLNCRHALAVLLSVVHRQRLRLQPDEGSSGLPPTTPPLESWIHRVQEAAYPHNKFPSEVSQRLVYLLKLRIEADGDPTPIVQVCTAKLERDGNWSPPRPYRYSSGATHPFAKYVRPVDMAILTTMDRSLPRDTAVFAAYRLEGTTAEALVRQMVGTERCFWKEVRGSCLSPGPPLPAQLEWSLADDGFQSLRLVGFSGAILPTVPPLYIDERTARCGLIESDLEPGLLSAVLSAPRVPPEHSRRVFEALAAIPAVTDEVVPKLLPNPLVQTTSPTPLLTIESASARLRAYGSSSHGGLRLPTGRLSFSYSGILAVPGEEAVRGFVDGRPVIFARDAVAEGAAVERLSELGWKSFRSLPAWEVPAPFADRYTILPASSHPSQAEIDQVHYRFLHRTASLMRAEGWQIAAHDEGDAEALVIEDATFDGSACPGDSGQVSLRFTLEAGGERLDLRPVLRGVRSACISDFGDDGRYYHRLPSGRIAALPLAKIKPVADLLAGIFGPSDHWPAELTMAEHRSAEIIEIGEVVGSWQISERLAQIAAGSNLDRPQPPLPLAGFHCELRNYQLRGAHWLQFLAEFGFGGILADDMGLGKTVQALAHLISLKNRESSPQPSIIVCPTSTVPNWASEISRFAPDLRTLILHGPNRKDLFGYIPTSDVVVTTYSLLVRDREDLLAHEYRAAILDEAQMIKSGTTGAARAAYQIRAGHRIALSGTPIENNIRDLWSIFRFALPGLLGSHPQFRRDFQIPIESGADDVSRGSLRRLIKPFVLRRTKEQVAPELPPKTIVIDRIEMEPPQLELYEEVRASRKLKLERSIAEIGLDGSRMAVLEALLRLRQICCDPRLAPGAEDRPDLGSAKLTRLVEMLTELHEAGRKALVFSQFTTMLDLIEPELKARSIPFLRLSGDTVDRATPVKRFQRGEATAFLISLKAGGTGLNLTAADTVIHYDPWWNPAVENQATDRAHRIGQEKPVFVYKLVAAGTVEERILLLQERKAELATRMLDHSPTTLPLTAEDIHWVLGETDGT